jgi:predicted nuclease of predicted toxin-antitoxin system
MTPLLPTGQGITALRLYPKTDFYQRSVAFGSPAKFIWLRVGNCGTEVIVDLLRCQHTLIRDFIESETESVLVLERLPQEG